MTAFERLDGYLERCTSRLRAVLLARGSAIVAGVALGSTLLGTYLITHWLLSPLALGVTQVLLLIALVVASLLGFRPMRGLSFRRTSRAIEVAIPEFEGRISTYADNRERGGNPMLELLAVDTVAMLDRHTAVAAVAPSRIALPTMATIGCMGVLLWLVLAAPITWQYGAQRLWLGWLLDDAFLPSIVVEPGHALIPRGGDLTVRAAPQGFSGDGLQMHARFGDSGEWERARMRLTRTGEQYAFTFVAVREPVEYFVSTTSGGVRSDGFTIDVVDMPRVERIGLTYHYPEWTAREPREVMHGGDIRAIKGTEVVLEIVTDQPLLEGALVVDGESFDVTPDGRTARGGLRVEADGRYFVAALHNGETVRLTPEFDIVALSDSAPDIELAWPGYDWHASPIEEVSIRVRAFDDFGVESVELRYSMNGLDWTSVVLDVADNPSRAELEHVFYLEDMRQEGAALIPGDLISYYAVARDHERSVESDLFFIEVQPYDRRYTEGQGAMGRGGRGGNSFDVSDRQREILTATWNLIRDRDRGSDAERGETEIGDRARMLSQLQLTLRQQALTLVERSRGRMLDLDQEMRGFIENIELATQAMVPAAEELEKVALSEAVPPEQSALQYLLRAESSLRDVSVSRQSARGGASGRMNQDLAELFELEMDPERNQYEMGQDALAMGSDEELDRALQELEELARREERLRNQMRAEQEQGLASRWQQEMLRRDAEQLRSRLEQMERRSGSLDRALRDLESAVNAIDQASRSADGEQAQGAMEQAAGALARAARALSEEQRETSRSTLSDLAERADRLYAQQRDVAARLEKALEDALVAARNGDYMASGLDPDEEVELALKKREMRAAVEALERAIQEAAEDFEARSPRVARALAEAMNMIRDARLQEQLAVAEDAILGGAALFVGSTEARVRRNLDEIRGQLRRAEALGSAQEGGEASRPDLLAGVERLRQELDRWNGARGADSRVLDEQLRAGLVMVTDGLNELGQELSSEEVRFDELERIRELSRLGRVGLRLNPNELETLHRELRQGLENLELALRNAEREGSGAVGARYTTERDEESDRSDVAEYFRRLSSCSEAECK